MANNYSAWDINPKDFTKLQSRKEKLSFLLQFGLLAPSMHNTQPWIVSTKQNRIIIHRDRKKDLPIGDPGRRGYYFGLGCLVENILIAADYFGYVVKLNKELNDGSVSLVCVEPKKWSLPSEHIVFSIPKRHTNRSDYTDAKMPSGLKKAIAATNGTTTTFILSKEQKDQFAELVGLGTSAAMSNPAFRKELASWLRPFNTSSHEGITTQTMGFPDVLSHIITKILPIINPSKKAYSKDKNLVRHKTRYMLVIATKSDTPLSWFETGRAFQRITVAGSDHGFYAHPLYGTVYNEEYREVTKKKYTKGLWPQFVFRFGKPTQERPHTPRLLVDHFIK